MSSFPASALIISGLFEPFISSSQIVPVIVLPSFLISGSSGSTVLLTHPASDSDVDLDELPSDEPCSDEPEDDNTLSSSSSFSFGWSSSCLSASSFPSSCSLSKFSSASSPLSLPSSSCCSSSSLLLLSSLMLLLSSCSSLCSTENLPVIFDFI